LQSIIVKPNRVERRLRFHSDWRIFADFAQTLIRTTLKLYASELMLDSGSPLQKAFLAALR
jgi:hypothetical protein